MPRKYRKGGESRLSLEGLRGVAIDGKVIKSIRAHGQKRADRTVLYVGGRREERPIYELVSELIKQRG